MTSKKRKSPKRGSAHGAGPSGHRSGDGPSSSSHSKPIFKRTRIPRTPTAQILTPSSSSSSSFYVYTESSSNSSGNTSPNTPPNTQMAASNGETAMEKAQAYLEQKVTGDKGFIVPMQKSFVSGDYRMTLPFDYANKYMADLKDCFIRLRTTEGKYDCKVKYSENTYKLRKGWRRFSIEHAIRREDAVVFTPHGPSGMDFDVEVFWSM